MRSIRGFLLTRLVLGAAAVLALGGVALVLVVTRALESEFDRSLSERVRGLASILFQTGDEVEFEFSEELMPEYERGSAPDYFELRFADGRLLERSPSLAAHALALPAPATPAPAHWTAPLPDGREGRFVAQLVEVHHVYPEEGPDRPVAARVAIVVARGRGELVAAERRVALLCLLSFCGLLALIAGLSVLAVRRGLEPAERLAVRLDALEVEHLPAQLELGELPAELAPVAAKTELLMRRVEAALERERRTTADIAHELRTPLSELLTVSEVALRDGEDPAGARRALTTVRDVSARMGRTVATLLELARLEMGAQTPERAEIEFDALVGECLRPLASQARARGLVLDCALPEGARVVGDREILRLVLANLLGNAVHYATPASRVVCAFERSASGWRLTLENKTDELEPADLAALARPFWRKDRARSDQNRTGLGLALARALSERAGLELEFTLAAGTFRAFVGGRD